MERLVGFNHEVLRGIRDYVGSSKPWVCHFIDPRPELVPIVSQWEPDGVIAFLGSAEIASSVAALDAPVVDVANWIKAEGVAQVGLDDFAIGRCGGEYLASLGFESFAFLGNAGLEFARQRRRGFETALSEMGFKSAHYSADPLRFPTVRGWTMGGVDGQLSSWLQALPKPVAIFADNDERALLVSEACAASDLSVPEDVAILGVDDDPYLCELGYPSISSIATPARRLGFVAARRLNEMMQGVPQLSPTQLLPPTGVVSRRSTDFYAYGDPIVASAMRMIRDEACRGLTVQDLADKLPVSRRTLERLFFLHVGRPPGDEIHRFRLEAARRLLGTTDLPLEAIAGEVGLRSTGWLSQSFESRFGMRPREYRRFTSEDLLKNAIVTEHSD